MYDTFNIVKITTASYNPQGNGKLERFHRSMKTPIEYFLPSFQPDTHDPESVLDRQQQTYQFVRNFTTSTNIKKGYNKINLPKLQPGQVVYINLPLYKNKVNQLKNDDPLKIVGPVTENGLQYRLMPLPTCRLSHDVIVHRSRIVVSKSNIQNHFNLDEVLGGEDNQDDSTTDEYFKLIHQEQTQDLEEILTFHLDIELMKSLVTYLD